MLFQCRLQGGQRPFVQAQQQLLRAGGGENFIEKNFERGVRDCLQPQRRLAHFADTLAQCGDVLGAKVGVQTEAHLQFVDRLGGDPGGKNVVQPLEGVVIAFEPRDALFDRKARLHRLGHRTNAGQAREAPVRAIRVHGNSRFASNLTRPAKKNDSNV